LRVSIEVLAVALRHVLGQGRMPAPFAASPMGGNAAVLEQDLNRPRGDAHIDVAPRELIRNAVVMAVDFDVVADIDQGLFPFGILVGENRQGLEGLSIVSKRILRVVSSFWNLRLLNSTYRQWPRSTPRG
jgi:hypothetical protein